MGAGGDSRGESDVLAAAGSGEDPGSSPERPDSFSGLPGLSERQARVQASCHLAIAPEVWELDLSGRRAIVLREPGDEWSSGLHGARIVMPEITVRPMSAGWVINVGPHFGIPDISAPMEKPLLWDVLDDRADIFGAYVIYGDYVGQHLQMTTTDKSYESEFLVLQEWELWGVMKSAPKRNDA